MVFTVELSQIVQSTPKRDNILTRELNPDPGMTYWAITSHPFIYDLMDRTRNSNLTVKWQTAAVSAPHPQTTTELLLSHLAMIFDHSNKTKIFLMELNLNFPDRYVVQI